MDELFDGRHQRRKTDGKIPWVVIGERILLWSAILGVVGAGAVKYAKLVETVELSTSTEKRVTAVEQVQAVQEAKDDERWQGVFDRLDRIERKLDRR